ncbi:ankyrin repeat-containing domain protein [Diplogelasinospora grovesii]|uniref:Ankyrin repeat-containing domain protein n=1 Tax=Diplogelasinospora grovesii TaxID=303347 RepID=A0AAN6NCS7_9PEZI|nr:ankyrin repeat-containing domain protein [Diplogelasinospora grovesii]
MGSVALKPLDGNVVNGGPLDDECVRDFCAALSADEKQLFDASLLAKALLDEVNQADANHKQTSTTRKAAEALLPFIAGIEQYGKAVDVFANSNDILCPVWGSVRILLHLAKEFGEYFEKLAGMLEEVGTVLSRLPRYPHLYPDNDNLRQAMVDIYQAIFELVTKARHVFRVGKQRSHGIKMFTNAVGLATALRVLWKPFHVQFGGIKDRISKRVQAIEAEADVAEKELANKERHQDDVRWGKAEQSQRLLAEFIDDQSVSKVNAWLAPVNVAANHKAASSLRHGETGSWFLDGGAFQTWLHEDSSFLWLHAIPGSGKTVLASSVINYLKDHVQSRDVGLAYFYCDYKDAQKQEPSKLLGTVLAMLAKQNRRVFENIQDFFLNQLRESPTFTAEFDELLNNFSTFLSGHFRSVVIVVDALDELDSNSWDCLTHAFKTLREECSNLKILVTSRDELAIARAFEDLPSTSIEPADVASDIRDFVSAEIADRIKQRKLKLRDPDLERVIRESLVEGSKGMFQWVRCQIETLCKLRNDKAIRAALSNLPKTLQDTYIRILQRVEDEHPEDVEVLRKVLCWLVRGVRNISLSALAEGIAIDPESGDDCMDFSAVDTDPEDILELLGGLVTVSADKVVSLAHYTVKEFLESDDMRRIKSLFWIGTYEVESQLATVCLTYLCYDDFRQPVGRDRDPEAYGSRLDEYKFLHYATQAWPIHAQHGENDGRVDERLLDLTMRLFQSRSGDKRNFESWAELYHLRRFDRLSAQYRLQPLYCAAFFGLTEAVQQLLQDDGDGDHDGEGGADVVRASFKAAASNGHFRIVEIFLSRGERAMQKSTGIEALHLGQALYAAAAKGHIEVMERLLDHGVDINARGGRDGTALQAAALQGRPEAVQLLLKRGANHAIPCKRFGTPLAAAAEKSHHRTVSVLLQAGANPNGRGGWYSSPLVSAIVGRNINIVRLLIESGADVNVRGGRHMYPIASAAAQGMDELVQELADCGAQVNDNDDKGSDALYAASLAGRLSTVELLLNLGADVNAKGGKHRNALGAASFGGHLAVVQRLIEAGADVHFFDEHYGNALQIAALRGHTAVVRALVDAGVDPSGPGGDKGTALVCAASYGHYGTIEALYELGVPSELDDDVTGALVAAAQGDHTRTVRLLVERGADPNSIAVESNTSNYCSPLEAAASRGLLDVVKLLLELGADATMSNSGWYGTPLIASISTDHRSLHVIQTLLEAGADPNQVAEEACHCYGHPLFHAAFRQDKDVVQLLLERGADVNLQYETTITALQTATKHENAAILNVLLEHGADVNLIRQPPDLRADIGEPHGLDEGTVTALQAAVVYGHEHVVRKLLDAGACLSIDKDCEVFNEAPFISALQVAAYKGHFQVAKTLIGLGGDVTEKGGYFGTALQAAVYQGSLDIARLLLEVGADANELGVGHYHSPLLAACWSKNASPDMIQLLVDHGADVNAKVQDPWPYALHAACYAEDDTDKLVTLLRLGADPNARGGRYGTALQIAAAAGNDDQVTLLLEKGADPNLTGGEWHTPLQGAYIHGYYIVIRKLYRARARNDILGGDRRGSVMGTGLGFDKGDESYGCCQTLIAQLISDHGFDVNWTYGQFGNALQNVILSNRADNAFEYILEAGADINRVGGRYGTALTAAAYMGDMDVIERLLERGAQVNLGNGRFPNAAFGAIAGDEPKALERLLKAGADISDAAISNVDGTALQSAIIRCRDKSTVKTLVRAGAVINPAVVCGRHGNPLQAAAARGNSELVRYFIKHGATVPASSRSGMYGGVLNAAAMHCPPDTVELLLQKKGADPNEPGTMYGTPLQAAAAGGRLNNALVLLRHGADVNGTGGKYHTPLQAACVGRGPDEDLTLVKLLVERGADVNKTGGKYRTALQAAAAMCKERAVRYLLDNGANWSLMDRKIAIYPAWLDRADEILQEVLEEKRKEESGEKEDEDEEWEEGEREDDDSDDEQDSKRPKMNVESIPGFKDAWKPLSRRRWDAVKDMSLHLLRQKSITSEPEEAELPGLDSSMLEAAKTSLAGTPRTTSLPNPKTATNGLNSSGSRLALRQTSTTIPLSAAVVADAHADSGELQENLWDVLPQDIGGD